MLERHSCVAKVNLKCSAGPQGYCVKVTLSSLHGFVQKSDVALKEKANYICIAKNRALVYGQCLRAFALRVDDPIESVSYFIAPSHRVCEVCYVQKSTLNTSTESAEKEVLLTRDTKVQETQRDRTDVKNE